MKRCLTAALIVLIGLFFFVSACSTRAGSSWVLWKHELLQSNYKNVDAWTVEEVFPTYETCVGQRDARINNDRAYFEKLSKNERDMRVDNIKDGVSYFGNIGGRSLRRIHSYKCLLKGADPRK
jgi:hypothetical protein